MIIEFPRKPNRLIEEYARLSEGWNRKQHDEFWETQKRDNTPLWNLVGGTA